MVMQGNFQITENRAFIPREVFRSAEIKQAMAAHVQIYNFERIIQKANSLCSCANARLTNIFRIISTIL